jgi:hypothetical protein
VCLRRAVVIGFVDGTACKRALAVWPGDTHQKTEVASTDVSWQPGDRPIYVRQPGRERLWAAEAVERIIRLSVREPGEPDKGVGPEVLDDRWLREAAIRLAISLDPVGKTPAAYAAAVRAHLQQVDWPGELTIAPNLGSLLRAPTASEWLVEAEVPGAFRAATIHSVKGQEFPGVVVVLAQQPPQGRRWAPCRRSLGEPDCVRASARRLCRRLQSPAAAGPCCS